MASTAPPAQPPPPAPRPRRYPGWLLPVLALVVVAAVAAAVTAVVLHRGPQPPTAAPTAAPTATPRPSRSARCPARSGSTSGSTPQPAPRPTCSPPALAATPPSLSPTPVPLGPVAPQHGLKPVLVGLLSRAGAPPSSYLPEVHGFVVQANWADLQPTKGGPIASNNAIDRALAQARQFAAQHPGLDVGLKLRVYAGIHAPEWAKSLGGAPIKVTDPQAGANGTVGRFWSSAFGQAYDDLQRKLAAKYDGVPEIREVVISRCTTVYAEPFIRDKGNPASVHALLAAGFTRAADDTCQRQEVDAHRVWQHTHSDLSFNPYQDITKPASAPPDEAFTEAMMRYCRATLGGRCVLENNSIRYPPPRHYLPMYDAMKRLGPPISFQTAALNRIGDPSRTLQFALQYGASSVELYAQYKQIPPTTLAAYGHEFVAQAQRLSLAAG